MSANRPQNTISVQRIDPWVLWFTFLSSCLIFVSLFVVANPIWHLGITLLSLIALQFVSPHPLRTLGYICLLVIFLATLQIIFSPFMRTLFVNSLSQGFKWSDWHYLLIAVERFAWPLVVVSSFQASLSNPMIINQLTALLAPLKWLGVRIDKLQLLIMLALRFIPVLQLEWDRFTKFQTYFVSQRSKKTMMQRMSYWLGVFKALVSHTIHRAVKTGDLLAIRGIPHIQTHSRSPQKLIIALPWIGMGLLFYLLEPKLFMIWISMTAWLGLVSISQGSVVKP